MSVMRERTEELELTLAKGYILPERIILEKGYTCFDSLGEAADNGYYTACVSRNMGQPVTQEEFAHIRHYAKYMSYYLHSCLIDNGKLVHPCLPVFFRDSLN